MKRSPQLLAVGAAVLAFALAMSGCSKKQAEAPPETTPPPAETPPPPPPPPPPPVQQPAEEAPALSWQDAFFDFDKYDIRPDAQTALDRNARLLRENAGVSIVIEGHCDERGTNEYNLALGERRAASARDYLIAAGVDASRIDIISYGEERPFAMGADESSWAQNRRAHLVQR